MKVISTIDEVRSIRRKIGDKTLGLVPTMGYLHDGHLELVRRSRSENEFTAVSIYVNPKQFGPSEDLSRYPRDVEGDLRQLVAEGVDLVFVPDDNVMYPSDFQTRINVTTVTQVLEGERRPTHFEGVTTVVAKLFNIIRPTRAYFGQKDAQQVVVIRQMTRDLNFDLELVVCPTVREADGLAKSSRNKYLSPEQRAAAVVLHRSLRQVESLWADGERQSDTLRNELRAVLSTEPLARVDYVSVADPITLKEYTSEIPAGSGALASMAVFFDKTRLIDNILLASHE